MADQPSESPACCSTSAICASRRRSIPPGEAPKNIVHRPRRLADAREGQGARPDRRVRRRQVDHRPVVDGLWPRRRAHHRRRGHPQRPRHPQGRQGGLSQAARPRGLLCRAIGGRRLQPGAQADGPGGRGDAAAWHGDTGRGRKARRRAVQEAQPAEPRKHRRALSAPGVGRPVAARDDGDGAVLRAGPDRLRRADHGARRDDADRRAGGDQGRHPRHATSRRSTSPTTLPSSPRSRTRSWCCAMAGWSNGAAPARSSRSRARNTPTRWSSVHEIEHQEQKPGTHAVPVGQEHHRRLWPRPRQGAEERLGRHLSGPDAGGGRRIRLRQVDAGARHHRPAAARSRARSPSTARPLPAGSPTGPRRICASCR